MRQRVCFLQRQNARDGNPSLTFLGLGAMAELKQTFVVGKTNWVVARFRSRRQADPACRLPPRPTPHAEPAVLEMLSLLARRQQSASAAAF